MVAHVPLHLPDEAAVTTSASHEASPLLLRGGEGFLVLGHPLSREVLRHAPACRPEATRPEPASLTHRTIANARPLFLPKQDREVVIERRGAVDAQSEHDGRRSHGLPLTTRCARTNDDFGSHSEMGERPRLQATLLATLVALDASPLSNFGPEPGVALDGELVVLADILHRVLLDVGVVVVVLDRGEERLRIVHRDPPVALA